MNEQKKTHIQACTHARTISDNNNNNRSYVCLREQHKHMSIRSEFFGGAHQNFEIERKIECEVKRRRRRTRDENRDKCVFTLRTAIRRVCVRVIFGVWFFCRCENSKKETKRVSLE